jgi:hypothetical protein
MSMTKGPTKKILTVPNKFNLDNCLFALQQSGFSKLISNEHKCFFVFSQWSQMLFYGEFQSLSSGFWIGKKYSIVKDIL